MPSRATIEWSENSLNPSRFFRPMTLSARSFIWAFPRFRRSGLCLFATGGWLTPSSWFTLRTDSQPRINSGLWSVGQPLCHSVTPPPLGEPTRTPEFIRRKIPVKYEKQRISPAALHRISCSCVGALSSVALFCCIFSFGTFFGFIRVYTVVFSDPGKVTLRSQLRRGIAFSSPKTRFKLFPN